MQMTLDLVRKRAPAQRHSPTSCEAAEAIEKPAESLRGRVWGYLAGCPLGATDEEMQRGLGMNPSTQRPRRIELVDAGKVRDSGHTRPTSSGRKATVWTVVRP